MRATREYKIFDKEEKARQKLITEFEARGANSYSKVCASEIISDSFTKLKTAFDTLTPQQQKSLNEAVAACTWRKKEGPYNGSTYPEIFKILNSDECSETVRKDALKVMAEGASLQSSRFKGIVEFQEYSFCSSTLRPIFSSDGLKLSSFDRELLYLAYTGAGQESSLETFISDPSFANQLENAKKELQRNSDLNIEETLARIQSAANAFYTK